MKIDQSWVFKDLLNPSPTDTENRVWLRELQPGDIIHTDREVLTVVRGIRKPKTPKHKGHYIYCVKVKRPHLQNPITLRACKEFPDCVEIVWENHDGWKQIEFRKWTVVRPSPPEPQPSVLISESLHTHF